MELQGSGVLPGRKPKPRTDGSILYPQEYCTTPTTQHTHTHTHTQQKPPKCFTVLAAGTVKCNLKRFSFDVLFFFVVVLKY